MRLGTIESPATRHTAADLICPVVDQCQSEIAIDWIDSRARFYRFPGRIAQSNAEPISCLRMVATRMHERPLPAPKQQLEPLVHLSLIIACTCRHWHSPRDQAINSHLELAMKRALERNHRFSSLITSPKPSLAVQRQTCGHWGYTRRPASCQRKTPFLSTNRLFHHIDNAIPIEEELLPGYKAENYYPVTIGQILDLRYRSVCKLGCGIGSTVWLAKDQRQLEHAAFIAVRTQLIKLTEQISTEP